MQFTIPVNQLKERGYTFQKLYAADYKTYRKVVAHRTIWLWQKGNTIEVDDWYQNTEAILNFFKENINHPKFEQLGVTSGKPLGYIKIQMNPKTGQVQMYDYEEYYKALKKDIKNCWDNWNAKYEHWQNEIFLNKEDMLEIIKEIEYLQTGWKK